MEQFFFGQKLAMKKKNVVDSYMHLRETSATFLFRDRLFLFSFFPGFFLFLFFGIYRKQLPGKREAVNLSGSSSILNLIFIKRRRIKTSSGSRGKTTEGVSAWVGVRSRPPLANDQPTPEGGFERECGGDAGHPRSAPRVRCLAFSFLPGMGC